MKKIKNLKYFLICMNIVLNSISIRLHILTFLDLYILVWYYLLWRFNKGSESVLAFYMSLVDDENEKSIIEELYKTNKRKMYSIAYSCLRNHQDAEDAVHEAFLIVIRKNKKYFYSHLTKELLISML